MEPMKSCMSPISLLYVEDDSGTRETIRSVLAEKFPSVSIRTAENGAIGAEAFQRCRADIVLTDINMPVMDGIEMTRRIRTLSPNVGIIAATAFSDTHYLMDAINAGISRYVLKPVNFKLLFDAVEDCIERVTMERRLESQNDTLRKLSRVVEQSPSMVLIADAAGDVEYANAKFSAVSGYLPEDVIGRNLQSLMTNASPLDVFQAIWSTVTGGSEWHGEIINRKKNGELYCEEISISSLTEEDGAIINFVLVMEDISRRKRAEDALKESNFLIDQSQIGAMIGSYKAFFASDSWESSAALDRILGIDKRFHRTLSSLMEMVHPDDREETGRYLREKIAGQSASFYKEFTIVRKDDGAIRKLHGLGKATYDHEGRIVSMIGTVRDITERTPAGGKQKRPDGLPSKIKGCRLPRTTTAKSRDDEVEPATDRRKAGRKRAEQARLAGE